MASIQSFADWVRKTVAPGILAVFTLPTVAPVDTANAQYLWNNGPLPPNAPAAQNNDNPPSAFVDHMMVLINGVLYDPSYGVTYAYNPATPATQLAGFAAALGGFMTIVPFNNQVYNFNLDANENTSYWVALFKPITVSMLQMR